VRPDAAKDATSAPVDQATGVSPELASWAQEAQGVLLTDAERTQLAALATDDAVRNFISLFWARRDPDPDAAGNPFQEDFDDRVAAADRQFAEAGTRGALTDRGRTLILLGRPEGRARSADLKRDTWYYERDHLPRGAVPRKTPKTLRMQFALQEGGSWVLADPVQRKQEVAEKILALAPAALIAHPELSAAPIPPLFLAAATATAGELRWLADPGLGFPEATVASTHAEVFPGHVPHSWVFVRLPQEAPQCDTLAGLLLARDNQPVGSFHLGARPSISAFGTAYGLSVPVPSSPSTLRLALASGGVPVAVLALRLELPVVPPSATWISPPVAGAEVVQQEGFSSWRTSLFGGYELVPRPLGRYFADETVYYFCHIVRPGSDPGRPPSATVRVRLVRGDTVIATTVTKGIELSAMAHDTYLLASSLPLSALPGPGSYLLELQVTEPVSGISRTTVLPVELE